MNLFAETVLLDDWKSFKVFLPKGRVKLHNRTEFTQFLFSPGEKLTIRFYSRSGQDTLVADEPWALELHKGRHYLYLPKKRLRYEIITVNHAVLVVRDEATDEKIFLTRDKFWNDRLAANQTTVM